MAGTYASGVPDPADTNTPGATSAPSFGSFDDLTAYGVSPTIAQLPVQWARGRDIAESDTAEGRDPNKKTYEGAVHHLYGLDPEQVGSLQLRLAAGGFFGDNPNFVPNVPEAKTRTVWDNVLKTAMRSDKTPEEVIQEAIEAEGGVEAGLAKRNMSGAGAARQPKSVQVTHPDDIRRIAKEISVKTLGRGWDNDQLEKFVIAYQAMDKAAGEAEGTRTAAPSVEAAAESAARRDNPLQAQAMDANNVMNMVIKAFSNLGGGAE